MQKRERARFHKLFIYRLEKMLYYFRRKSIESFVAEGFSLFLSIVQAYLPIKCVREGRPSISSEIVVVVVGFGESLVGRGGGGGGEGEGI